MNTGTSPVSVRMVLYADSGTPLSLPLAVTQQGATQALTAHTVDVVINPDSTLLVATTSHNALNVEGWVDVLATGPINGYAIFTYAYTGGSPSEGTVSLQTQVTSTTLDVQYDNTGGDLTGIALANLSFAPVTVTATVWDAGGNQLAVQSFTLPGSGHTSFGATDKFPVTAGKSGLIQFQSSSGLAGIGLRFSPSLTFTSVPTFTP